MNFRNRVKIKKSICFVIPGFITKNIGGAELQLYLLSEKFINDGWLVEVVTSRPREFEYLSKSKYYNEKIKYHYYRQLKINFLQFFTVFFTLLKTQSHIYYQRTDHALTAATPFTANG